MEDKNTVESSNAWLLYTKENRVHAGNDGYDDDVSSSYVWDDTVAHYDDLKTGDTVVLWDGSRLLGVSVISGIKQKKLKKSRYRCPACKKTKIRKRKTTFPEYRCGACKVEFDHPTTEIIDVNTYRTDHAAAWVELAGVVDGDELRAISESPLSQQSMRVLDQNKFEDLLNKHSLDDRFTFVKRVQKIIKGGHKQTVVNTRVGQGAFRKQLLDTYGSNCAISGAAPAETIHACHLYSYAKSARHEKGGGLLLRSDLHSLFDRGYLKIHPDNGTVSMHSMLKKFPNYWHLNGGVLQVSLSADQKKWIQQHWDLHPFD